VPGTRSKSKMKGKSEKMSPPRCNGIHGGGFLQTKEKGEKYRPCQFIMLKRAVALGKNSEKKKKVGGISNQRGERRNAVWTNGTGKSIAEAFGLTGVKRTHSRK